MNKTHSHRRRMLSARSLILAAICCVAISNAGQTEDSTPERKAFVERTQFIQIPGPNPIISPGPAGAWDDRVLEASDAFKAVGAYYFYYHATGAGKGYRIGVASSNHPLGPFKKHGDKPVLDVGPEGTWEERHVACAMVVRSDDEKDDTYYMWYSGCDRDVKWSIGLATAPDPLGPWTKYEGNPVLTDFGYLGGVIKIDGKYRLYSAHPIRMPWARWEEGKSRSPGYHTDYSPLAVAIGEKPEGPFKKYEGNPLMERGSPGDWDDGGISEAEVLYNNGMFHMFYGGTRTYGPRMESVGYAYSFDGLKWFKYGRNPVASHHAEPNAAAFAEVHAIFEFPFVFVYHTLRLERRNGRDYPWVESLGVQVLATQKPFSFDMPVMNVESLGPGKATALADSPPLCLGHVSKAALTVECAYAEKAKKPVRVRVRASHDGINYDTVDLFTFENDFKAGKTARRTFDLKTNARFVKIIIENQDDAQSVSDIKVIAALSG